MLVPGRITSGERGAKFHFGSKRAVRLRIDVSALSPFHSRSRGLMANINPR